MTTTKSPGIDAKSESDHHEGDWLTFDESASTSAESMDRFIERGEITVERMYQELGRPASISDAGLLGQCFLYLAPPEIGYYVSFEANSNQSPLEDDLDAFFRSLVISRIWRVSGSSLDAELIWGDPPERPSALGDPAENEHFDDPFAPDASTTTQ